MGSVKVAELTKLLENIHRAVNLGMINEFKIICDAMNVDPFEVIEAASTKTFGFVPYYPGPGWEVIVFQLTHLFILESKRVWLNGKIY